jgi:DNA-binding XRE family transcriptional regulator
MRSINTGGSGPAAAVTSLRSHVLDARVLDDFSVTEWIGTWRYAASERLRIRRLATVRTDGALERWRARRSIRPLIGCSETMHAHRPLSLHIGSEPPLPTPSCSSRMVVLLRNTGETQAVGTVETIGQRIKRERLDCGLTQRDLALAVGVGVPHVSKVEADRENPSDELLCKIAEVLRLDADELLLVARRVPGALMEKLAASPSESLQFLRTWKPDG